MSETLIRALKEKYQLSLMNIVGVTGVGNTTDRIIVYVQSAEYVGNIPLSLEGVPVMTVVAGTVKRF